MTARYVHHFADPLPDGADARTLLGGKGASLKAMTRAGLRVPGGFTITTEACGAWLESGGRWPEGLAEQVDAHLSRLEADAGRSFGRGETPLLVSVRSGAARSMPGMMDTLLNVGLTPCLAESLGDGERMWGLWIQFVLQFARTVADVSPAAFDGILGGRKPSRVVSDELLAACRTRIGRAVPTDPREILHQCIDAVFASWNNTRAIDYRRRNNIRGLSGTAVNVQTMWPSEVSGIVFTQDPTGRAEGQLVVEASYGLGEAVVSGDVSPDRYLVRRENPEEYTVEVGEKATVFSALGADPPPRDPENPCLSAAQLTELTGLALRVEEYFGHPVDIEWGLAGGQFALLQARAIRGLEVATDVETGRREQVRRLRELAGTSRKVWVAHNLCETLPSPTPLTWNIVREFMSGRGGFGRLYRTLGYRPSREVSEEGFLELINGRIYADPDRLPELFWDGMPMEYDLDALLEDRSLLDAAPTRFAPERADSRFLLNLPGNLLGMLRSHRRAKRLGGHARERFEKDVLPDYLAWIRRQRQEKLTDLSGDQLIERLERLRGRVLREFAPESLLPGFFGGMVMAKLTALLEQIAGPQEGASLAGSLALSLEGDITFKQDAMLYDVARGRAAMGAFLERFGHRCLGEMELSNPRWNEDDRYLRTLVDRFARPDAKDPRQLHRANAARREQAERELPETLRRWGGSSFEEEIRDLFGRARELLPFRETGKHYLMMGYELIRRTIEELARRSPLGQDVYYLQVDELPRALAEAGQLVERVSKRKVRHASAQRLHAPDVIDSNRLDSLGRPPVLSGAETLPASALAGGVADGPARIVTDPSDTGELGSGYVLVCASTDPAWTPLFMNAAALVVERGGALSHGAIVARDFGIPAVALGEATRLLPEGQPVRVDGNVGSVTRCGSDPQAGSEEVSHA
jgi:pyruvate,water dikinase